MKWHFEKFIGDMAIYGICPRCGAYKSFSVMSAHGSDPRHIKVIPSAPYNYCPMCGTELYHGEENADIIWNERDISVLYTDDYLKL